MCVSGCVCVLTLQAYLDYFSRFYAGPSELSGEKELVGETDDEDDVVERTQRK